MTGKIRLILSMAAIIAGVVLATSAMTARTVSAGNEEPSCEPPPSTSTPTSTATQEPLTFIQPGGSDVGIAQADPTATCTPTPGKVKTATPTVTDTPEVTDTPVPPTEGPATNTPVPPTATPPGGGVGGQGVSPPNTGSGPDAASSNWTLAVLGAILALGGMSSLVGAALRRR